MRSTLFFLLLIIPLLFFYSRNGIASIDDKSFDRAKSLTSDTVDVSSVFLSIKYQIDKTDTAKSGKLLREQREFLVQYGLPVDGVEEIKNASKYDYVNLSQGYSKIVGKLENHQFRDLYRQVCSQILIKRICSLKSKKSSVLLAKIPELKFFLQEMMDSGGINIALIYASCLKFQYSKQAFRLCEDYRNWLAYSEKVFILHKAEVKVIQTLNRFNLDEVDNFILADQKDRLAIEGDYVDKIKIAKNNVCRKE